MHTTDTIVIGAGQAGLAMSRCLSDRGVDHVVLERGRRAERWRSERWDSLRLLTPNWMTGLPGLAYDGDDPDGFMRASELVRHLERYADASDAPVEQHAAVESLSFSGETYAVRTASGAWRARNVVIATGWCDRPAVPMIARHLPRSVHQVTPDAYRNPAALPPGGVLVVGASATGVQLADELRADGRDVVLSVGRHARLPRRYRGMDIFWWLSRIGHFDRTIDEMPDPVEARRGPSIQLVGRADGRSVDLATLQRAGVQLAGRLCGVDGHEAVFASGLDETIDRAERQMRRVLARIDDHIVATGLAGEVLAPAPIPIVRPASTPPRVDLRAAGIRTVVWATGHRREYPWLSVPVLDAAGEIRQHRGVTPAPGLYVLGQRFQHRHDSSFVGGVGRDAEYVADHLVGRAQRAGEQRAGGHLRSEPCRAR